MKKKLIFSAIVSLSLLFTACNNSEEQTDTTTTETTETTETADATAESSTPYDPTRGEGKYDATNLSVSGLDNALASKGEAISNTKCLSCHKTTDERLVGPGWKGVTQRRTLHWIMNFITNPDPMIDKDPEVQKQLEECLVRMPDQSLNDDDARAILEYMRKVDGAK